VRLLCSAKPCHHRDPSRKESPCRGPHRKGSQRYRKRCPHRKRLRRRRTQIRRRTSSRKGAAASRSRRSFDPNLQ